MYAENCKLWLFFASINANNSGNIINYEIIINQENVGTVKNMNGALKQAQGEIIIPLAADDIFYNDHVITDIVKRFAETRRRSF
ncbi:glycosyltransferase [Faecalibacterium prausnitzii]|uniref:Glycosyltransferase n=1 Tax=Faecalibacterium prausnitzii TaxID=853 RepID=A0A6G1ZWU5_9FIRM|nr:glycosyltransferase [Faecalibacterium prausnitzii]MSC89998.1 glycosyltransferase [Faecalibacterium prausnitzii]